MGKKNKEIVIFDSGGPSGNIFAILGATREVLRKQQRIADYNELWKKVSSSQSYEEALEHIGKYVDLVDIQSDKKRKDIEME